MKKYYSIILFYFLASFSMAQNKNNDNLYGFSIGYMNQAGSFGKFGLFYIIASDTFLTTKIDANANMAHMRDKFRLIPEIGITGYLSTNDSSFFYPFIESEFTPYTITPKFGFTLLTIIDYSVGYGFMINEKNQFKPIKGFQFSVSLNFPLNFDFKF